MIPFCIVKRREWNGKKGEQINLFDVCLCLHMSLAAVYLDRYMI